MEQRAEVGDSDFSDDPEMKADDGETDVDSVVEGETAIQTSAESPGVPEGAGRWRAAGKVSRSV